jgi:hypothetical protein
VASFDAQTIDYSFSLVDASESHESSTYVKFAFFSSLRNQVHKGNEIFLNRIGEMKFIAFVVPFNATYSKSRDHAFSDRKVSRLSSV